MKEVDKKIFDAQMRLELARQFGDITIIDKIKEEIKELKKEKKKED